MLELLLFGLICGWVGWIIRDCQADVEWEKEHDEEV